VRLSLGGTFGPGGKKQAVSGQHSESRRDPHGEETLYSMFIPWESLGLRAPPKERHLGFSLLVNDSAMGLENDRKGLQISEGILEGLRPQKFGKLWLRH